VQSLRIEMKEIDFRHNLRIRRIVGISIMVAIAALHAFRIGQFLNGDLYIYYYSFASDLILPFGAYFMLSMVEIQFRFLRNWFVKALIVFAVMTFSEIMQIFGFYFFGVTFDILDILMFGIGVFIAVLVDTKFFERFMPNWKYTDEKR
jgi:hypothetical protein